MDKREQFFGSDVSSEDVFDNVGLADKYKTSEEVKEAIAKLQEVQTDTSSDSEFVSDKIMDLERYLKFLEIQEQKNEKD